MQRVSAACSSYLEFAERNPIFVYGTRARPATGTSVVSLSYFTYTTINSKMLFYSPTSIQQVSYLSCGICIYLWAVDVVLVSKLGRHAPRIYESWRSCPSFCKADGQTVTCSGSTGGRLASVGCAISATPRRTWAITRRREQLSLLIQQHACWNAGF
ncbi:unnamed protein product [Arctia plantaginis]|uniref:Uncharacterized protein n=1 Tax=Arctia plantaginis TaxID=874455 RepID=A0A8S0YSJ9_ARCPL|nr:unnamed protein product [Arctia plantaginis]